MNRIKEAKGNLVDLAVEGHFNVIAHPCNCQNIMAIGVAKQVKEKLPEAELADFRYWKQNKACRNDMLGRISTSKVIESENKRHFVVVNMYTQLTPGPAFNLRYFKWALEETLNTFGNVRYALPVIHDVNIDYQDVKRIIYDIGAEYDITIIH